MKLTTANGKQQIKISKNEWLKIGFDQGWATQSYFGDKLLQVTPTVNLKELGPIIESIKNKENQIIKAATPNDPNSSSDGTGTDAIAQMLDLNVKNQMNELLYNDAINSMTVEDIKSIITKYDEELTTMMGYLDVFRQKATSNVTPEDQQL
tara:strand:- start:9992 stop:10444 length:453 start_codon:yes stop_codon:yes gene_type:complete